MPENGRREAPARRGINAFTIVLAVIAAGFGYVLASRVDGLFADRSGIERRFAVMTTEALIIIPPDNGSRLPSAQLADLAEAAIREVDTLMSPVGEDSDVRRLNQSRAGEWVEVSPVTWTVVMEALRWHRLTGGAFDPTIGPVKRLFAFNRQVTEYWPDPAQFAEAFALVGADKLDFEREGMRLSWQKDGMRLDLGAIAKGYSVDRAIEALRSNGVANALVEVGGELRTIGMKTGEPARPWRTGIQNPRGEGAILLPDISGRALATSGDYSRYFIYEGKRYEHIIDPRTGLPLAEGVASVTVLHPESCMAADALATSLTVLGRKAGRAFLDEQALGLFNMGVEVTMLLVDEDGGLVRVDFKNDGKGGFSERESVPEFAVSGASGESAAE